MLLCNFLNASKQGGCLISKYGLRRSEDLNADHHYTYSFDNADADVYAANIEVENGAYRYNVIHKEWEVEKCVLHMGGLHNIENSIAAITVAKYLEIDDEKIKTAIASFKGVKRRFEYILRPSSSPPKKTESTRSD